jgi:ribosomal subunit interface protein
MLVRVSGKQIEIGGALPERVRTHLQAAVDKYFDGGAEAAVVFSREGAFYRAGCTVHLDSGVVLKVEGQGPDAYRAFDAALDRVGKRLRRYTRKLKSHHDRGRPPKGALS